MTRARKVNNKHGEKYPCFQALAPFFFGNEVVILLFFIPTFASMKTCCDYCTRLDNIFDSQPSRYLT